MTSMTPSVAADVERYLRTGDSDPYYAAWSGAKFIESARLAHGDLENALIAEVSVTARASSFGARVGVLYTVRRAYAENAAKSLKNNTRHDFCLSNREDARVADDLGSSAAARAYRTSWTPPE